MPMAVTVRSKAWVWGRSLSGTVGSNVPEEWKSVCYECCILSGRGHCVGLITRPEESYRLLCVWVWSQSLGNGEALVHYWMLRNGKKCIWILLIASLNSN